MAKFIVLRSRPVNYGGNYRFEGYFTGRTYILQGEEYAVCDCNTDLAKKYKTEAGARRGCDALNRRVINYLFDVSVIYQPCNPGEEAQA